MKQIAESLKKAIESGRFTTEQMREFIQEVMTTAARSVKGAKERLRKIADGSIIASVEEIENGGNGHGGV